MYGHVSSNPALELFRELLAMLAPSGREERIARVIREKLDSWGYSHETDSAGSILVRLDGRCRDAPVCCLAAHMDEITEPCIQQSASHSPVDGHCTPT